MVFPTIRETEFICELTLERQQLIAGELYYRGAMFYATVLNYYPPFGLGSQIHQKVLQLSLSQMPHQLSLLPPTGWPLYDLWCHVKV
mmetsp:Transcript_55413/g.161797  ORF Transcript_55413/g.161797 Transcript_55413/m.161797 type:complete len:87 (+) Transcript_55413:370-630(+)